MSSKQPGPTTDSDSGLNKRDYAPSPPFTYFENVVTNSAATTFVNQDNSAYVVVFGLGFGAQQITSINQSFSIQIKNNGNLLIDAMILQADNFGTPTTGWSSRILYFPKKMIIPPGGLIISNFGTTLNFQAFRGKFEDIVKFII